MYHISDLSRYQRCPKQYYLARTQERSKRINYIRIDEAVSILGTKKLKIKSALVGKRGDGNEVAFSGMKEHEWLIKARFEYAELRVKIPFMQKTAKGWNVYFIFIGILPRDSQLPYYARNLWVLRKLGISIDQVYVIYFNKDYQRQGELDYNELLLLSDCFYSSNHVPGKNISEALKSFDFDYAQELQKVKDFKIADFVTERAARCHRRVECPYYHSCFNEEELPDDSLLFLTSFADKYKMYHEGYRIFADLPLDDLDLSRQQYAQLLAERNGGLFMDKALLKVWLQENIREPVSFLDFEWDTYALYIMYQWLIKKVFEEKECRIF